IHRNNPFKKEFFQEEILPQKDDTNWSDLNSVLNNSILHGGLQELLRYADRNSMAHSREVRLPFLYHKLVEFVFSLPSHYKMNHGWSKLILRKSQDAYLPSEICWRKEKVGYATPQNSWMANRRIQESENEKRLKLDSLNIFDAGFIKKIDSWKVINLYNVFED
ncbi:MAG: asparagine synthase-related protein, partial [Bacteroidia bacterium]|nr:asparagine synthase-related protein [Bacteroidia bacterium]